jgi:predicted Co/Zn/Cd cation transporter (cation efflux family)
MKTLLILLCCFSLSFSQTDIIKQHRKENIQWIIAITANVITLSILLIAVHNNKNLAEKVIK